MNTKLIIGKLFHFIQASLLLFVLIQTSFAQTAERKQIGWDELKSQYEFPKWYTEARFGIWLHWGAQTQPEEGGGWYARHMYMQDIGSETFGKNAYTYHIRKYGHPSEVGYKEVINS